LRYNSHSPSWRACREAEQFLHLLDVGRRHQVGDIGRVRELVVRKVVPDRLVDRLIDLTPFADLFLQGPDVFDRQFVLALNVPD
jgi:hypothetical protein